MHLDDVTGGPGMRRDDRRFAFRQQVEQRRLAGIRRPGDGHHQPLADALAAMAVGQRRPDLGGQFAHHIQSRSDQLFRHVGLVGKIDTGLDQRQRLDQPPPPGLGAVAEQALHLPERLPPLPLRLGADQIGKAFNRCEVELAVLEGAAGELARLSRAQALDAAERLKRGGDHRGPAVNLEFGGVFAGLAVGRGKPQRQSFVDDLVGI